MRVVIMKDFIKINFPNFSLLDYALAVEKITTAKVCIPYCLCNPLCIICMFVFACVQLLNPTFVMLENV